MSYYNQPLLDDWARPRRYKNGDQIEKVQDNFKNGTNTRDTNTKMAQAIFLPGAWGKIPDFMGKNRPTPGAAMAFFILKTTPPLKPDLFRRGKNFLKILF